MQEQGLVCLITGSSRGIGLAIAHRLAKAGQQVILNSPIEISQELLDEFKDYKYPADYVVGDVSDFQAAERMVEEVIEKHERIDVLVNNAGITRDGLLMRMKEEDFDAVIDVNLKGVFNMMRFAVPKMLRQRSGSVINMSSVSGIMGNAGQTNYSASKAGVVGLTKAAAREVASRGITINAIAPGFIETEMTGKLSEKNQKAILDQIPLKRYGHVDEVAHVVEFLVENRYITGQVIDISGGMNI